MQCRACNYPETRVVETSPNEKQNVIRRRRECLRCQTRFNTEEQLKITKPKGSNETRPIEKTG
jgi:transcriptional repressor NrdR